MTRSTGAAALATVALVGLLLGSPAPAFAGSASIVVTGSITFTVTPLAGGVAPAATSADVTWSNNVGYTPTFYMSPLTNGSHVIPLSAVTMYANGGTSKFSGCSTGTKNSALASMFTVNGIAAVGTPTNVCGGSGTASGAGIPNVKLLGLNVTVHVPSDAYSGTYTSTFTFGG